MAPSAKAGCLMRLFILARHGESVLNVRRMVNGDPHRPVELTPRGEEEARRLGDQIRHIPVGVAICTSFRRTRRTAELALHGRSVPIEVEPALDDIDVGALDGHSVSEFRFWKRRHRWSDPFPDGESLCAAGRRYAEAFRWLLSRSEPATLVVCHAAPIRYLLDAADGFRPLAESPRVVDNAVPYLFDDERLASAADRLEELLGRPRALSEGAA
jgi:ribonuclease H / adenosylcobalamin/alpha-ribazole phosphatase